jgi:hypothetical protein
MQIREATSARIIFPNDGDANPDMITIIGKKENVLNAKQQLLDVSALNS